MTVQINYNKQNALETHVAEWLIEQAEDSNHSISGIVYDLLQNGCASGMVSHLVYTTDCRAFLFEIPVRD